MGVWEWAGHDGSFLFDALKRTRTKATKNKPSRMPQAMRAALTSDSGDTCGSAGVEGGYESVGVEDRYGSVGVDIWDGWMVDTGIGVVEGRSVDVAVAVGVPVGVRVGSLVGWIVGWMIGSPVSWTAG